MSEPKKSSSPHRFVPSLLVVVFSFVMQNLRQIISLVTQAASWATAVFSLLPLIHSPNGRFQQPFTVYKTVAGALAWPLLLLGTLGTPHHLFRRRWLTGLVSAVGTLGIAHYIRAVHQSGRALKQTASETIRALPNPSTQLPWPALRRDLQLAVTERITQDLVLHRYADDAPPLLADLWHPPLGVPSSGQLIIYLHGSGWHYLDKDFMHSTRHMFRRLAAEGHTILDVAYTLVPKADWRQMLHEVKRAVAWGRQNGRRYGFDPQQIVLMGGSAGGHLSLLAAYTAHQPELAPEELRSFDLSVSAVISYYGITDLLTSQEHLATFKSIIPDIEEKAKGLLYRSSFLPAYGQATPVHNFIPRLMGGSPEEIPDQYRLASPLHHVGPHCPPTLLINGLHDIGVLPDQHRRLRHALQQSGVPVVHHELPYADHAFDLVLPAFAPATQSTLHLVEHYLHQQATAKGD